VKLDFLILADKAEALNGKLYMIGGAIDRIGLVQIPGPASFDVAIGVLVDYHETRDTHRLTLRMETADNQPVYPPIEIPFATGSPLGLPAGDAVRFTAVVQGPFPIPAEGAYHWVAEVDGQRFDPRHFRVTKVTPFVRQERPDSQP
jgi:hypothetical protein